MAPHRCDQDRCRKSFPRKDMLYMHRLREHNLNVSEHVCHQPGCTRKGLALMTEEALAGHLDSVHGTDLAHNVRPASPADLAPPPPPAVAAAPAAAAASAPVAAAAAGSIPVFRPSDSSGSAPAPALPAAPRLPTPAELFLVPRPIAGAGADVLQSAIDNVARVAREEMMRLRRHHERSMQELREEYEVRIEAQEAVIAMLQKEKTELERSNQQGQGH